MRLNTVVCTFSVAIGLGAGCSHARSGDTQHGPGADMATAAPPDLAAGGSDASVPPTGPLTITPTDPVVQVTVGQTPPTVQFTALVGGQPATAAWFLDRGEIGAVDMKGLFATTGAIAGKATVTAVVGAQTVKTSVTVQVARVDKGDPGWSANPPAPGPGGYGGVGGDGPGAPPSPTQTGVLDGPSTNDKAVQLLYPYDGTVWPRGLLAPLLQWNPGAHSFDAVLVDIKETNYEYKGYFANNAKTAFLNLPLPQAAWDALTYSNGGEPVTVSLTFAEGGKAYGGYSETWTIAKATLKGSIYYNSYGTYLVKNSGTDGLDTHNQQYGAATLAIKPGATDPVLVAGVDSIAPGGDGTGCRVCHTVSADGKTLVTQASSKDAQNYGDTRIVDLLNDTTKGAGTSLATKNLVFPALYKDGSLLFSSSSVFGGNQIPMDPQSQLYALPAGTPVSGVTGLPAGLSAMLPVFSPDGAHLAFTFWGGTFSSGGATVNADKASLAIIDFDGAKTFANPRLLFTPPAGQAVTFSSFLPAGDAVVYEVELGNKANTWGYTWNGNTGELWWLDVASKKAHALDLLNGNKGGVAYLPSGPNGHDAGVDPTLNYEPTVNPIASGGYAWVVFTSRRLYGNVAAEPPFESDPRQYDATAKVTDKKLWVAAVDLGATPGTDPSHPAFYLPAQELHAGNSRGFWTVEKCRADGQSCETGDECCGGYCQPGAGGGLMCTSTPPSCAAEYEKCNTTSDCCGAAAGIECINHICTTSQPPIS